MIEVVTRIRYKAMIHNQDYSWIIYTTLNSFIAVFLIIETEKNLVIILVLGLGLLSSFFVHMIEYSKVCRGCGKRIYPIFRDHMCQEPALTLTDIGTMIDREASLRLEKALIKKEHSFPLLESSGEREKVYRNLLSMTKFSLLGEYKYAIITMGSILEYLLGKYIKCNGLNSRGDNFVDLLNCAIKNDIFNQEKRWKLIQSHLRDFRNYIHIDNEVDNVVIDESWFSTISPVFWSIIEDFQK